MIKSICILILCIVATTQAANAPALTIRSPQDYQVFQRRNFKEGVIAIEGDRDGGTGLEMRLDNQAWQDINRIDSDGRFSVPLPVPAGGWYKLEIRLMDGEKVAIQASIDHVGVGEVFVVAGQSNSCNYGKAKQKTATGRVGCFDGEHWRIANDPQRGGGGDGGSFMPAFGDALATRFNVPIGVVPCGIGATSVREWLPKGTIISNEPTTGANVKLISPGKWQCTGKPFDGLMQRVEHLGPHGFRAILWHQGESDAGQARAGYPADRQITGKQYTDFMEQLIRASREQAKWDIPWFVAQATYHSSKDAADEEFRGAQKALWDSGIALQGPDTDALGGEYRAGVHFNEKGLAAHGGLWAEKVGAYLDALEHGKGNPTQPAK